MSEKITAMIEEIKALTVLELSELVKAIEKYNQRDRRFGGVKEA